MILGTERYQTALRMAAEYYGVNEALIPRKITLHQVAKARALTAWLLRHSGLTHQRIAELLGRTAHVNSCMWCRLVEERRGASTQFYNDTEDLRRNFGLAILRA